MNLPRAGRPSPFRARLLAVAFLAGFGAGAAAADSHIAGLKVTGANPDPALVVLDAHGHPLAPNDNWTTSPCSPNGGSV